MFTRKSVFSLVLPLCISQVLGQSGGQSTSIRLDVNSQDSVKSAASSLAGGIIAAYNDSLASKSGGIPGLFDGKNTVYFWEAGTLWNAMLAYSYSTGDSKYDASISQALQFQLGDSDAYMPANQTKSLGNDDQSCWSLAAMTAAEVDFAKPKDGEWVDYAKNVWETQQLWQIFSFNNGYNYKNTWSNGNLFLLSARLAKFTGNGTYSQFANKVFQWSQMVGLVDEQFRVFDGTDTQRNCSQISRFQWTATHGLYTEGAALMYNMTGAQKWTEAVKGFVNSSSFFETSQDSGVLTETTCEKSGTCNADQRAFKGVFARTLARTALAAPLVAEPIRKILSNSAAAAAMACTAGSDPKCGLSWTNTTGMRGTATGGSIGEVYFALEVIQGLLYSSAKALKSADGPGASGAATSGTQSGSASGTSGAATPQHTGSAGSVVANTTTILLFALAAVMSY
ncbi:hydrolase 76 protein [Pleosporales sp. CAS-2024a]